MVVFEREKIRKLPLQKACEITVICILSAIITIYNVYDLKKDIESNIRSLHKLYSMHLPVKRT
jgi:hypothetical protein